MKDEIIKLRLEGKSYNQICAILGCSKSTISVVCNRENLNDIGLGRVPDEYKKCETCNIEFLVKRDKPKQRFCCKICADNSNSKRELGRLNGLKSVKSQNRRSKNEIYFFELCYGKFDNVINNMALFNGWDADIIIEDYKLAILWNGKWHYEKIREKHSVKQVQNRDKIKINEIIKMGYEPYVIKDMGKFDKHFVEEEFNKLTRYISSLS